MGLALIEEPDGKKNWHARDVRYVALHMFDCMAHFGSAVIRPASVTVHPCAHALIRQLCIVQDVRGERG